MHNPYTFTRLAARLEALPERGQLILLVQHVGGEKLQQALVSVVRLELVSAAQWRPALGGWSPMSHPRLPYAAAATAVRELADGKKYGRESVAKAIGKSDLGHETWRYQAKPMLMACRRILERP